MECFGDLAAIRVGDTGSEDVTKSALELFSIPNQREVSNRERRILQAFANSLTHEKTPILVLWRRTIAHHHQLCAAQNCVYYFLPLIDDEVMETGFGSLYLLEELVLDRQRSQNQWLAGAKAAGANLPRVHRRQSNARPIAVNRRLIPTMNPRQRAMRLRESNLFGRRRIRKLDDVGPEYGAENRLSESVPIERDQRIAEPQFRQDGL